MVSVNSREETSVNVLQVQVSMSLPMSMPVPVNRLGQAMSKCGQCHCQCRVSGQPGTDMGQCPAGGQCQLPSYENLI